MLKIDSIDSYYGITQVLFGLSLNVQEGEVVTLLGRNGMGKSTTIRSIIGMIKPHRGDICFNNQSMIGLPPYKIAQAGIGLAPEGRHIFTNLSVRENLIAAARNNDGFSNPWTVDRVLALFPGLEPRISLSGNKLSGGEQQMLSIGRALMTNPRLLLLDEATEGLSPLLRRQIWHSITELKDNHQSILLIDKNLDALLQIGDRHYIVEKGHIAWTGNSDELAADKALQLKYLGI